MFDVQGGLSDLALLMYNLFGNETACMLQGKRTAQLRHGKETLYFLHKTASTSFSAKSEVYSRLYV